MDVEMGDKVRIMAKDGKTVLAEGQVNGLVTRGEFPDIVIKTEEAGAVIRGANITEISMDGEGVYAISTDVATLAESTGIGGCGCGAGAGCGCGSSCGCGSGGGCGCSSR